MVRLRQARYYFKTRGLSATLRKATKALGFAQEDVAVAARTVGRVVLVNEVLGLKPGEWVEVKSADEIRKTLDAYGFCRGLYFMDEMWNFTGRRFQVLKRVNRMMVESTGTMRAIKNTVLLDGTTCDGSAHNGCDVCCHHLWREAWLQRIGDDESN